MWESSSTKDQPQTALRQARRHAPTKRLLAAAVLCVSCSTAGCTAASAASPDMQELQHAGMAPPDTAEWDVTLGLGVAVRPRFPGARDYRQWPVPLVSLRYRDLFFVGPQELGLNVVRWRGLRFGPVLGMEYPRYERWDSHLHGLGDIQPTATAGVVASYSAGPFIIIGTARQAIVHASYGLLGRIAVNYEHVLIPGKLVLILGPELDFGNRDYARTWFGVSAQQSERSGLPIFSPPGGMDSFGLTAGLVYHCTGHVLLRSFVGISEIPGGIAKSPIVQRKDQVQVGVAVAYHF